MIFNQSINQSIRLQCSSPLFISSHSILTLTPCMNQYNMHSILVADPNGTTHPEASVWKSDDEGGAMAEVDVVPHLSSLMRSSVETTLDEDQQKELNQELFQSQMAKSQVIFSEECDLVIPMLVVHGKLEMTNTTLSFTMSSDWEKAFRDNMEALEAQRQKKNLEGLNKYSMLTLPENRIWKLNDLTHEEYRLHIVCDDDDSCQ